MLVYVVVSLCAVSCGARRGIQGNSVFTEEILKDTAAFSTFLEENPYNLDARISLWLNYTHTGHLEELVDDAHAYFSRCEAEGMIREMIYSLAFLSQSYYFMDRYDSSSVYIARAEDLYRQYGFEENTIESAIYNIKAVNAIKMDMNYPMALDFLIQALEVDRKTGDLYNSWTHLVNISSLYYTCDDSLSLKYALEALQVAKKMNNEMMVRRTESLLSASYLLVGRTDSAYVYSEKVFRHSAGSEDNTNLTSEFTVFADVMDRLGRKAQARRLYDSAMVYLPYTNISSAIQLYMSYARHLSEAGDIYQALEMYGKGLKLADETRNSELKYRIEKGLSDCYDILGDSGSAYYWFKKYHNSYNEAFSMRKTQEFNSLMARYNQVKLEEELGRVELQMAKSRLHVGIVVMIAIVLSVVLVYIHGLYSKKKKMYSSLQMKYVDVKKKEEEKMALEQARQEQMARTALKIFEMLEVLMKEEKLYRRKDISLQTVSEILGSNSSYVSKAINQYSNRSFANYVNMFRVEEAKSMLSDSENDYPMKYIADFVGYGNISTFYRSFQKEVGCSPSAYRDEKRCTDTQNG